MKSGLTPGSYLDLSALSYDDLGPQSMPNGWEVVDHYSNEDTGYSGVAFRTPDGGIVVSHRGSDELKDYGISNRDIVQQKIPDQFDDAEKFMEQIFENQQQSIYIEHTGHSLGGALAQMIAHKYDSKAIAFDPPGTQEIIEQIPSLSNDVNHNNFETYIARNSLVSSANTHIGNVVKVELDLTEDKFWVPDTIENHYIENLKTAFGTDGQVNQEMVVEGTSRYERIVNKGAEMIGDSPVLEGVGGLYDMGYAVDRGIEIFRDDSLSESEKVAKLDELFSTFKEGGADVFMGVFDKTFGEVPFVGAELSEWADKNIRNFIVSDNEGGLEDISNRFGDWMGRQGTNLLEKIGFKDDLEKEIRKRIEKYKERNVEGEDELLDGNVHKVGEELVEDSTNATDAEVQDIAGELKTNIDLLYQNMERFTSSISGI